MWVRLCFWTQPEDGQLAFECAPVQHVFSHLNDSSHSVRRKNIKKLAPASVEAWANVNGRHEWPSLEPPVTATAANCKGCGACSGRFVFVNRFRSTGYLRSSFAHCDPFSLC